MKILLPRRDVWGTTDYGANKQSQIGWLEGII
jgi:hypothetical protein